MTVYIDPPNWPGHGRMWSHLISDRSFGELHAFAAQLGVPPRAFERDHYDLPSEWYAPAVTAGAVEIGSKELVRLLHAAGLRRPKGRCAPAVGVRATLESR
ncbi:DUF4031 domain-containing protein [Streptomyces sp. TP-A0874]|uniref:DUF4031 domain-containing protein n=1 Tax=Streptomyces sp. TP-A0874 TaxID=549819 RepID=UPI000853E393|nr:DUF4031 domain-containing protein [Streptomyces sp. TP-A0874]